MKIIDGKTKDGLNLTGGYYESNKDICIVFIHGMSTSLLEDSFARFWGDYFQKKGIGFIYGHTRGYSRINSILCNDKFKTYGTAFEIFEDCLFDISLWVNKAKEFGYQKIILLGHSYGALKCIYYSSLNNNIDATILASAPDFHALSKIKIPIFDLLLKESKINIDNNESDKLLSFPLGDENYVSSKTYYSWYNENSLTNLLPIGENKDKFEAFSKINVPLLMFAGSKEHELYKGFNILKTKVSCPFNHNIIEGSGHNYHGFEEKTANLIYKWIMSLEDN